ncbi:hypothetical protein TIFTF001_041077 [Ficus carica]|uniref:Uncharacterized protein n=1 Tax=Ficus carica TaxID=3494 RepID=A0AA87ZAF0_FICCA|nr:hypothetical protein TIFTF001_041066 [Ficus carica]GMN27714.1 hypothetical protein TIFTF001_041070 [Ficus carica]GMN27750.1 hypothetical protein TIFTF001_041073 [Ficus carica]GMN27770.1 hypothetical protein TIFTF001_041077 [Ficus carica]
MSFNKQEETCSCTQRRSSTTYDITREVSNLPAISDAKLWKAGAADCEMWDGHCHSF